MKNIGETIKLLEHIQDNPEATQRELVAELDVSLGKVNFLVRSLVEKGIIKLQRFKKSHNKMGYLYIITPKGMSEKAVITRKFLENKIAEYDRLKEEIEKLKSVVGVAAEAEGD